MDIVAGIPDSGIAHAIGYANEARVPYRRPFVKYTPTWPRSFMPQDQRVRDLVARMKLIPADKPEEFTEVVYEELQFDVEIPAATIYSLRLDVPLRRTCASRGTCSESAEAGGKP